MRFEFCQWHPNPDIHSHDDAAAVAGKRGEDLDGLLQLWQEWLSAFPSALKTVTLTSDPERGYVQLRFWFGEPSSIRRGYVDSCGHNLVVHIGGPASELSLYRLLRDRMVGDLRFAKRVVDDVEVWRLIA